MPVHHIGFLAWLLGLKFHGYKITILIPTQLIYMRNYCFIFSNIYQNNNKIGGGFPLASGQVKLEVGQDKPGSHLPKWVGKMSPKSQLYLIMSQLAATGRFT